MTANTAEGHYNAKDSIMFHSTVHDEAGNQNYQETERSEEIWEKIMEVYHMEQSCSDILKGCNSMTELEKKLYDLKGLLNELLEREDGSTSTIDKKIIMVEETIMQYEVLIETLQPQAQGLIPNPEGQHDR